MVDLGSMFAKGKYQKQFFSAAESELEKENSQYYNIAARIIEKTNEDALLSFRMNLGYNALTHGARKIRKFETEAGYNVPWVLLLELSENGSFDAKSIDSLIHQGKDMGIFSYIFILQSNYSKLHPLASVLAKRLRTSKLLCTSFCMADNADYESIEKAAQRAAYFDFKLVCIMQNYSFYVEHSEETKKMVDHVRSHLDIPVLPFDLLSDMVMVDRNISTESCLAIVLENGEFYITNMETGEQKSGYNLINTPLCDILSHALPKTTDC